MLIPKNQRARNRMKSRKRDELSKRIEHFNLIYAEYPKKVGKSKAFDYYTQWLKGRKMSTGKNKACKHTNV